MRCSASPFLPPISSSSEAPASAASDVAAVASAIGTGIYIHKSQWMIGCVISRLRATYSHHFSPLGFDRAYSSSDMNRNSRMMHSSGSAWRWVLNTEYKVTYLTCHRGWVDLDLYISTCCQILRVLKGIWQSQGGRIKTLDIEWPKSTKPYQNVRADDSPCVCALGGV